MRRMALAGGLAVLALAGTAGYAAAVGLPGPAGAPAGNPAQVAQGTQAGGGAERLSMTNGSAAVSGARVSGAGTSRARVSGAGAGTPSQPTAGTGAPNGSTGAGSGTDTSGTAPASTARCGESRWQRRVQGAPTGFSGGDRAGDYLWHGPDGFHLRVTHRGDRRDVFAGYLRADQPMSLRPFRLEGRDAVWLSADRKTLGYRFYDYGHIDGVDFVTRCASRLVGYGLTIDGHRQPASRVYLGHFLVHPAGVPFTVVRRPA